MLTALLLLLYLAALIAALAATALDPSAVWLPLDLAGLVGSLGLGLLVVATRPREEPTQPGAARRALKVATAAWAILSLGAFAVVGLGVAVALVQRDIAVALLAVGAAAGVLIVSIMASTVRSQFAHPTRQ